MISVHLSLLVGRAYIGHTKIIYEKKDALLCHNPFSEKKKKVHDMVNFTETDSVIRKGLIDAYFVVSSLLNSFTIHTYIRPTLYVIADKLTNGCILYVFSIEILIKTTGSQMRAQFLKITQSYDLSDYEEPKISDEKAHCYSF